MYDGESVTKAIDDLRDRIAKLEGHPAVSKAEVIAAISEESNVRNEETGGPGEQGVV